MRVKCGVSRVMRVRARNIDTMLLKCWADVAVSHHIFNSSLARNEAVETILHMQNVYKMATAINESEKLLSKRILHRQLAAKSVQIF